MKKISNMQRMSINGMTLISTRRRRAGWNFIAGEPGRASGGHFLRVELFQEEHGQIFQLHGDGKDGDIKPLEQQFTKYTKTLNDNFAEYRTKLNALISKSLASDVWKATGSGEVNLRYLDDVARDTIQNGYVLSYNSTTKKFEFISPTAASFTPTDVQAVFAEIKNAESFTITKGQAVYLHAATGNKASVKLAYNTGDPTSAKTLGLVYSDSITAGGTGLVITQGVITGVDT